MIAAVASVLGAVLAASDWAYVSAAYVIVFGAVIGYAAFVIVRGRKAGRHLPPEERRWTQ